MEEKIIKKYVKEISDKVTEEIYESKELITSVIELVYDVEDIFLYELVLRKKNKGENAKESIIIQYFLDFAKKSKEFLVSILLCSRISTAVLLRNIIENYVLLYYIFISEENIAMRYLLWDTIKGIPTNKIENEEVKNIVEKVKAEFEKNAKENLNTQRLAEEQINKTIQRIYKSSYGWCYELVPYNKRLNFNNICKSLELDEVYKDFDYLSSTVHSNEMAQKMFNNVYFYDHVLVYIQMYLEYVEAYLTIYLEIYDPNEDKLNKLEEQILTVKSEQMKVAKEMKIIE